MVVLVIGDVTAPLVEKSLGLPGVSIPHGFAGAYVPIAFAMDWLIDRIPGINKITINVESMQKRFGVFGDPVLLGSLIGLVIGILAGYGFLPSLGADGKPLPSFLACAVAMGAVMVLIPKMAALLMEGLLPISDAASAFIQKHFQSRGKIYIGLDSAVGTGHPVTLTMALILVPFAIALALPHVDAVHITKPYIAIVKPRTPILFSAMAGVSDEPILASLIVNLGLLKHNEQQVHVLSAMMEMFMDSAHVARIAAQTTQAGMVECFQSYLQL